MTLQEAKTIKEHKTYQSRIIFTADKGVAIVVMDSQDYISNAQILLGNRGTYGPISKDLSPNSKICLFKYSETVNPKDKLAKPPIKDFTLCVQSQPNCMDYPRSTNRAPL